MTFIRTPMRMWNTEVVAPAIEWSWVEERLDRAVAYWVATSSVTGAPSPRPLWGCWLDDRLLLTVGSTTHRRNLLRDSKVSVHLGDDIEVVVLEGSASVVRDPALLKKFVAVHDRKYDWETDLDDPRHIDEVFAVDPAVVLAWLAAPVEACSPDMDFPLAAGRWVPQAGQGASARDAPRRPDPRDRLRAARQAP